MEEEREPNYLEETDCTCAEDIERKLREESRGGGCRMVGHNGFPSHRKLFKLASEKLSISNIVRRSMSSDTLRGLLDIPERFATKGVSVSLPIPVCLVGGNGYIRRFGGIGHMTRVLQESMSTIASRMDTGEPLFVGVGVPGVKSGKYGVSKSYEPFIQDCEYIFTRGRRKGEMCGCVVSLQDRCPSHRRELEVLGGGVGSIMTSIDRLRTKDRKKFLELADWMREMSDS